MYNWHRFQFFDKEVVKEGGSVPTQTLRTIEKLQITCCSSGRGRIIFGGICGLLVVVCVCVLLVCL
jgi:hypothetical protein